MYPEITKVSTVSSLGGGPIGAGWAAYFLSKGYKVKSYIHDISEKSSYEMIVNTAWTSLKEIGLHESASLENLLISTNLKEVLHETHFVQESIPEVLDLKRHFYQVLGKKKVLIPDPCVLYFAPCGCAPCPCFLVLLFFCHRASTPH